MSAELLNFARRVQRPTLFFGGRRDPEEFTSLDAAAERIREVAGREPRLGLGVMTYPGFDTVLALHVRTDAGLVCSLADRWHDEGDVSASAAIVRGRLQALA